VPAVQHLCSQSQPLNQESGPNASVQLRAPLRIAIDVAGPFPWSDQGNWYLLIAVDYFTKWPEAYAIPSQEASTVMEVLVTNFFHFTVPQKLHSDQGCNFESRLIQECSNIWEWARPAPCLCICNWTAWSSTTSYKMLSYRTRWTGMQDCQSSSWPTGHQLTTLWAWPQLAYVLKRTPTALQPAVWGTPRQGTTHNRSHGKFSEPSIQHPQLCLPTPAVTQEPDENSLQLVNCVGYHDGDKVWLYYPTHKE
jgi:hypothetical protein